MQNISLVHLRQGLLRGNCSLPDSVCFFGDIPFAAAPVGVNRWKAPQPPPRWTGERNATIHGPMCLQVEGDVVGDEDCLYLNVYATRHCLIAGGCAAMIWIHGGGYMIGSGINYDGTKNAALAKDVLIVTINYRLSALGYAALPWLASIGNFGLQDQRAAMRWVRANIGAFGGVPSRVTVFGESAGATSVTCHLCAPASRDLFAGAIMESGAFAYWAAKPLDEAKQQLDLLLDVTGCAGAGGGGLQCLYDYDARNLTSIASNASIFGVRGGTRYAASWAPIVDGTELSDLPGNLLARNECLKVPLLLGVNRDEGTLEVGNPRLPLLKKGYNLTEDDLDTFFKRWLRSNATLVGKAWKLYAVDPSSQYYSRPYWSATHFVGDLQFSCPAMRAARHYAAMRIPQYSSNRSRQQPSGVFVYFFDHPPRNPPFGGVGVKGDNGSAGVSHAFELPFVWQGLPRAWAPFGTLVGADEALLGRTMAAYWTNFARGHDPNVGPSTPLTIAWPRSGMGLVSALQLDLPKASSVRGRWAEQCAFVDSLGALPFPEDEVGEE